MVLQSRSFTALHESAYGAHLLYPESQLTWHRAGSMAHAVATASGWSTAARPRAAIRPSCRSYEPPGLDPATYAYVSATFFLGVDRRPEQRRWRWIRRCCTRRSPHPYQWSGAPMATGRVPAGMARSLQEGRVIRPCRARASHAAS